jgi:hypothetical protein
MKSHEVLWNLLKFHEISWSPTQSPEVYELSWGLVKSREVPWSPLESLEVTWSHLESLEVSWDLLKSNDVLWSFSKSVENLKSQKVLKSVASSLALGYTFSKFGKSCETLSTIHRTNKDWIKTSVKRYKFCKNLYGFV